LIFQYRTEVEWHLREEHRSGSDEETDLRAELRAAARPLDWDRLRDLRFSADRPAISLVLSTTPGLSMTVLDVARLRQLANRARRRLPAEPDRGIAVPVLEHRLSRAVATAEGSPTDRGLAVLVSERQIAIVTLPFEPRDRAVVDRAFATRDLEYALQRYPLFRVLVLGSSIRILEGRGRDLTEVDARRQEVHVWPLVDQLLDQRLAVTGTRPLVVVGDRRRLNAFRQHSCHAPSIAAEVHKPRTRMIPIDQLAHQALARWRRDQQDLALAELHLAEAGDHITWGLLATWRAVAGGTAKRVWVEHDYAHPGRIVPGADGVQLTSDPAEPGAIDDLVDTLISRAHRSGARVDLLDSGALDRHEPIAAQLAGPGRQASGSQCDDYAICGAA
jgi:hypothetical protein